jgi:hypothetical protein
VAFEIDPFTLWDVSALNCSSHARSLDCFDVRFPTIIASEGSEILELDWPFCIACHLPENSELRSETDAPSKWV